MFRQFARHVLPGIVKPLRVLWNEVIGFVFLALAVVMGFSTYRNATEQKQGLMPLIVGGLFVAMLFYFGLTSFLRARKIGRN